MRDVEKRRAYEKAYYEKTKEKQLAAAKERRRLKLVKPLTDEQKAKRSQHNKQYYILHKAKLAEYAKKWRTENKEKMLVYAREYYKNKMPIEQKKKKWAKLREFNAKNPEYYNSYYLTHKDEFTARTKKRQMILASQFHPSANLEKIEEIYKERTRIFKESGLKCDVDHIIPISCGGWHHENNLQILPDKVNKSKGADPFWERSGFKSWRDVPQNLWPQKLIPSYLSLL